VRASRSSIRGERREHMSPLVAMSTPTTRTGASFRCRTAPAGKGRNACIYAYGEGGHCVRLATRGPQEEGGYEDASYKPHVENGKEEAHVEGGLLYQPLGEGTSEGETSTSNVLRLCKTESEQATTLCARDADFLGIEKAWHEGWHALKKAAHSIWNSVDRSTVSWNEFLGRVKNVFHTGKEIFGLGKCVYETWTAKGACPNP